MSICARLLASHASHSHPTRSLSLFQVALAILKINGEEILSVTDDGAFINVLRNYFATLGESAHPDAANPKHRNITNFQE